MIGFQDPEICRNILENLQTGVCVLDLQQTVVFWSTGAERITGYLRHEVVGRQSVGTILPHCDQRSCELCAEECPLGTAIRSAQPAESTGFLHHKNGHQIPVHRWSVPVRNAHGSIIGAAESFEERHQTSNPEHREESFKASGCVDEITGIANHAMMQSHLRETLGTFDELHVPFGIMHLRLEGLDGFRTNCGQEAASSLLRAVAQTLDGALWKTDFVGRWSHDQFLIILNGCSDDAFRAVKERLRRMLASEAIEWWGEMRSLPVSIGVAIAQPGDTVQALLKRAQQSLADTASGPGVSPATDSSSAATGS